MLSRLIQEVHDRHSKKPISKSQFERWQASAVTKRLHEDLELAVIDAFQDYLPEDTVDNVAVQAMLRQGASQMVERVLDWAPVGLTEEDNQDD